MTRPTAATSWFVAAAGIAVGPRNRCGEGHLVGHDLLDGPGTRAKADCRLAMGATRTRVPHDAASYFDLKKSLAGD